MVPDVSVGEEEEEEEEEEGVGGLDSVAVSNPD